jgi:hypothetical protein
MPEVLRKFLESLVYPERDQVWDYLDGDPDAIHEMIELVATDTPSTFTKTEA